MQARLPQRANYGAHAVTKGPSRGALRGADLQRWPPVDLARPGRRGHLCSPGPSGRGVRPGCPTMVTTMVSTTHSVGEAHPAVSRLYVPCSPCPGLCTPSLSSPRRIPGGPLGGAPLWVTKPPARRRKLTSESVSLKNSTVSSPNGASAFCLQWFPGRDGTAHK